MDSKPVINFNQETRSSVAGVEDLSIKIKAREGFTGSYLSEDRAPHTKHFSLASNVAIVDEDFGLIVPVTNIPDLVLRTKNHLKAQGISCTDFAFMVLNVNSPYFASMCSQKAGYLNKEWSQLCPKMQVCYSRMAFWMEKLTSSITPQPQDPRPLAGESKKSKSSKLKKPRTLMEDIRRKLNQEAGSSGHIKGYHHIKPDGNGAANVKLEASDEVNELVNGEYFESVKEENQEIAIEQDGDVVMFEILVDVDNVATIIYEEEVMES